MNPTFKVITLRNVLASAVGAMSLAASSAQANVVVLDNLPGDGTHGTSTGNLSSSSWGAVGLTTGSSSVDFISLRGFFENTSPVALTLDGGIYSNVSGHPGSSLATFNSANVPAHINSPTEYTLTTTAPGFTLAANTEYWFVLKDIGYFMSWMRDSTPSGGLAPTPAAGYTFDGYMATVNSGCLWSSGDANGTVEITVSGVSSVPEPGQIAASFLTLLGLGGFMVRQTQNRRRARTVPASSGHRA